MRREYNVIDADGHILEPVDLWDNYIEPPFRTRAPRMFVDTDGKDRLNIDGKIIGGPRGLGRLGGDWPARWPGAGRYEVCGRAQRGV